MQNNFYGADLYVMYADAHLESSRTSTMEHLCENHKKALL